MAIQRMDHVGVVVEDLDAAIAFFGELGLEAGGRTPAEGEWVDRIVGLAGVRTDTAMVRTPDGQGCLELIQFRSPSHEGGGAAEPANVPGLRHVAFVVDDIEDVIARLRAHGGEPVGEVVDYKDIFRLCYLRGPAGIIVELAERLG